MINGSTTSPPQESEELQETTESDTNNNNRPINWNSNKNYVPSWNTWQMIPRKTSKTSWNPQRTWRPKQRYSAQSSQYAPLEALQTSESSDSNESIPIEVDDVPSNSSQSQHTSQPRDMTNFFDRYRTQYYNSYDCTQTPQYVSNNNFQRYPRKWQFRPYSYMTNEDHVESPKNISQDHRNYQPNFNSTSFQHVAGSTKTDVTHHGHTHLHEIGSTNINHHHSTKFPSSFNNNHSHHEIYSTDTPHIHQQIPQGYIGYPQQYDFNTYDGDRYRYRKKKRGCCVNCGKEGHLRSECPGPVTSFGIIAFRKRTIDTPVGQVSSNKPILCEHHLKCIETIDEIPEPLSIESSPYLYLMVQRKDTMGFIDFIRGKYPYQNPDRDRMLMTYLSEMTCHERDKLLTWKFDDIWDLLWVNHNSKCYHHEYHKAKALYTKLDIPHLLSISTCNWTEQEYGFPKGRKTMYESNALCAIREYCEESGYNEDEINVLECEPIEESFIGTNNKAYRHVYLLAEVPEHVGPPRLCSDNLQQVGEIKNIAWFTFEQCMKIIRPYDTAKKETLQCVKNCLEGRRDVS